MLKNKSLNCSQIGSKESKPQIWWQQRIQCGNKKKEKGKQTLNEGKCLVYNHLYYMQLAYKTSSSAYKKSRSNLFLKPTCTKQ